MKQPLRTRQRLILVAAALLAWSPGILRAAGPEAEAVAPILNRYAIVIGNGDYTVAPDLENAVADAQLVADFFADQGYQVLEYRNLGKLGFEQMLRRALHDVNKSSEVVFYYAGHGVQIAGGNYLVPVDADLDDAYDVPFETISLSSVVNILGARARLQMIILDSCRDNPFGNTLVVTDLTSGLSETRDGFNTLTAPINSLLAFSTAPGKVAFDGAPGTNSPFTSAMVETARAAPDTEVSQLFEQVRRVVYERTEGRQMPWESSTLIENVSFQGSMDPAPPRDDGGALGQARGVMAEAAVAAPAPEAPDTLGGIVLAAPLESEVAIGPALGAAIAGGPGAPLAISVGAESGRLLLLDEHGRRLSAETGVELTGAEVSRLVYASAVSAVATGETGATRSLSDRFTVRAGGEEHAIEIALEADPCDAAAGDHLDPQGVGIALFPNEIEPEAALEACRAAVAARPDVGRFHYQLGRAQLALRQLDEAQGSFETARDLGHIRAWYALGILAANEAAASTGRSDTRAPQAALDLYRSGVENGDPFAFHALGRQLLRYGETDAERNEGFELLSRSLEVGHTYSMNELGYYFLDPEGPHYDPGRGMRYLQESANRDDIYGYNNLGLVYLNGLGGVETDPELARSWFEKAAVGGHPQAPGNLGRLWNSGALGGADAGVMAIKWYDMGLERGDGWSGANAAWIIANRDVPGMTATDAAERAAKAAALGNAEAEASAREILAELPASALDGAAQRLVNALGGTIGVDGAFGASSQTEMARVVEAHGAEMPPEVPVERAVALAGIYWRASKFRVDLY